MNIGIIGAGFFGEKHAQALEQLDDLHLVAACRGNQPALEQFVRRYGGRPYPTHEALLEDRDIDAVVIATPHATHEEIAVAAARAGKHILLEKPMAPDLGSCERILEAVHAAGVKLALGHVTHFSRAYTIAKELLDSGDVGAPVAGLSTMRKRWHEPNRRSWHLDRAQGGGVLLTGGVHAIDRLTWLMGAEATSVSGQVSMRFHDQRADDAGVLFIRYRGGGTGIVFSIGYANGAPRHDTEIVCTNGVLRVDSVGGVWVGQEEEMRHLPESGSSTWMNSALVDQWRAFQRMVELGAPPAVSGEFGLHIMKILFAAEESTRRGTEIVLA